MRRNMQTLSKYMQHLQYGLIRKLQNKMQKLFNKLWHCRICIRLSKIVSDVMMLKSVYIIYAAM